MTGTDHKHGRLTTDRRAAAELLERVAIGNEGEDREAVVLRLMDHETQHYADAEQVVREAVAIRVGALGRVYAASLSVTPRARGDVDSELAHGLTTRVAILTV